MRRSIELARIKSSSSSDWSLNDTEVESRRIQYGLNDIIDIKKHRWLELIVDTAKDPMIWFLIATGFLFSFLNYYNQAIILFLATIPLITMDAFLHWRTQVSTQGLLSRLAIHALVIRNGVETKILARDLVPGDLLVVASGMFFPADGIVIAGHHLQVDESALTGEAVPVSKKISEKLPENVLETTIESQYWGFAGTRLLTGRALVRVVYTGKKTLYGEIIASAIQSSQEHTPLQKAIYKLIVILIIAASLFCIILALVRYYQGFGLVDAILSAATLAVAALPDEFPVVFTFFLGLGVYRLARKKALVRRAVSVENIGRISCICSDKTGTITEGRFKLIKCFPEKQFQEQDLLYGAALASRAESGDPLDIAIYEQVKNTHFVLPRLLQIYPYTEERKRETSIYYENENEALVLTKGAPELILEYTNLSEDEKKAKLDQVKTLSAQGYKVIASARRFVSTKANNLEPTQDYEFLGLLTFADPPRKGVIDAIKQCQNAHIHVLMITGDHPDTARYIANEIGLGDDKSPKVITADEIQEYLENNTLHKHFRTVDVIARALPLQKVDIVQALRSAGEIVAVTGDGVNDVPALKIADIGIAMGERGTQSAREVADIVLLDDNFESIVNAISEGRQLFKNLRLSFKYLLMIHIPFVFSAALVPLLGYPLLYYPVHIVIIELFIHPTSMLVFQDLPQAQLGPELASSKIEFFTGYDWFKIIFISFISLTFVVLGFIGSLLMNAGINHARALSIALLAFTSAVLTLGLSGFITRISRIMILSTLIITVGLIQSPFIADKLSLSPLRAFDWLIIILYSFLIFAMIIYTKEKNEKI